MKNLICIIKNVFSTKKKVNPERVRRHREQVFKTWCSIDMTR